MVPSRAFPLSLSLSLFDTNTSVVVQRKKRDAWRSTNLCYNVCGLSQSEEEEDQEEEEERREKSVKR